MPKERFESIERAKKCGLSEEDAIALRRIALTLRRWFELECGDGQWLIERAGENADGKPFMVRYGYQTQERAPMRFAIPDRETGARKRLDKLMARYPNLKAWIQTDPRGGTIYLCKPEDATDSLYTRGVFIA